MPSEEGTPWKVFTRKPRPGSGLDCLICAIFTRQRLGGVPREQKMLKGHLPRVIHHQVYKIINSPAKADGRGAVARRERERERERQQVTSPSRYTPPYTGL